MEDTHSVTNAIQYLIGERETVIHIGKLEGRVPGKEGQ